MLVCGIAVGLMAWLSQAHGQDPQTERYFQQLRQRRLFSVAEQFGLDRLSDRLLSPAEQIQVSVELSKTYAEHARFTSGDEHAEYWQLAEGVIDDALVKFAKHPRRLLLDVQRAFLPALRGEFLRGQLDLYPYDKALRRQTTAQLKSGLDRLKPLESALAQEHRRLTMKKQRGPDELATYEVHDLHAEVRFRLAVTLQELAKAVDEFSPERPAALREAARWLELLSEARPGDPFKLPAKIRLAENHRMQDDLTGADLLLKEIEEEHPPAELQPDLLAERIRWLLAQGQLPQAADLLQKYRRGRSPATGELAFLNIKVLIGLWEIAEKKQDAATAEALLKQIESSVEKTEEDIGGYWGARAAFAWEQLAKARKYGSQVAELLRRAEARYAAGETKAAVDDYALAADLALKNNKPDIAFELGYTKASILLQTGKFAEAEASFQQLAKNFPQNPRAANAHLLEAYCLGKLYDEMPTQPRRESYTKALADHVETYPDHETAGDAYWMMGAFEEQRRQVTLALKAYREVPAAHRRGPQAQIAVARCYEKVLKRLEELEETADDAQKPALREKTAEWDNAAAAELGQLMKTYPEEPRPLDHQQADVGLILARLQLTRTTPDYSRADGLLERILVSGTQQKSAQTSAADTAEWNRILKTARQLRIVSLAGQGLSGRAEMLVKELSDSSTEDVLGVMDGLMQVAKSANLGTRRKLGELQLQTAEELNRRRDQLAPDERERLDHCRAQAYLASNRTEDALKIYNQMLAAQPKNRALKRRIAALLAETENRASMTKAKDLWREMESQAKPGSARVAGSAVSGGPAVLETRPNRGMPKARRRDPAALSPTRECRASLPVSRARARSAKEPLSGWR